MKTKFLLSIFIFLLIETSIISKEKLFAQTKGTLTFSVTPTEIPGGYYNKIVLAIWIEDSAGNFVKTKMRYASTYIQYLNVWISKSNYNVVDAITGPTTTVTPKTFTWNATDINGIVVPDGTYKIRLQMSDANNYGQLAMVTFHKGTDTLQNITFANQGNFTNMQLTWKPDFTKIDNTPNTNKNKFKCYPNPAKNFLTIDYYLSNNKPITIFITDSKGRIIKELIKQNGDIGKNTITWKLDDDANQKVPAGVYYIILWNGQEKMVEKVFVM